MPLLLVLAAYLLGAVPTAYLLGRWRLGVDISREGSGNIGASNVARRSPVLGAVVLLLDATKGAVPTAIGQAMDPGGSLGAVVGLAAAVGHCWSVYRWREARKGGKGIATLGGASLVLAPGLLPICLAAFVAGTRLTGYRALGTLIAATLAVLVLVALAAAPALLAFGGAALLLLIVTHSENLRRIMTGQEERGLFPRR
ncbi:MAG TPA: glycerol-3-phosphate acyltransferase [Chloroflexia bacterium]|nr:glycerol-3-phosphate acyltransferase [Chloroflexia bacterium]